MNKKFIIIATVFVDVLGMGIIIPTLPFYVQSFGVSAFVVTLLFGVFSFFAFFSAPLLGALSDKIGRRPVMIISIASSALGWLVFASAHTLWLLFLGRIIDGLAAGNFSTAQSFMADIAKDEKERTKNLGLLGAVFGVAFIIGPGVGGLLSNISPTFPFWCVGILASLNAVNAFFNLPESHHKRQKDKKISLNPFQPIIRITRDEKVLPGFFVWFLFGISIAMYQAIFSLYLEKVFFLGAFAAGLFMTGVGVIMVMNQGFLLSKFWLKNFKEKDLEFFMMFLFSFGFFLMSTSFFSVFIIGMFVLVLSQSILRVVITSQVVGNSHENRGEVLGAMSSVLSLSMIMGPLLAGSLFISHPHFPFLMGGFLALFCLVILYHNRRKLRIFEHKLTPPNDQTII